MKIHKLAEYFPILEGEEFDLLVEDIKERGQQEPIVMVDDEILDGVNRWRACDQLGIEPITEQYTGDDPLAYVISLNIRRRHLEVSQRAALATEMLPEFEKQAKERQREGQSLGGKVRQGSASWSVDHEADHLARDDAARVFGVSGRSVQRAKQIKEEAPEEFEKIRRGKKTVGGVDAELRIKKAEEAIAEDKAKGIQKAVRKEPRRMARYYDAVKVYKSELEIAIEAASQGSFSPESIHLTRTKHQELRVLMEALEEELT